MSHSTSSQSVAKDERAWLQMLGAIGPLTYQAKDIGRSGDIGEMGWVVSMDATQLVLAAGARAGRGLGVLFGLLILPASMLIAWLAIKNDPLPGIDYGGMVLSALILFASVLAISFDLRRVSENLVLFDRKAGRIIAADPTVKFKRAKDIRFLSWNWQDCDFAIERVVMSATAAQTFHLRAVRRNAQGTLERSIVLMAMIPSMQHAEAVYEFLRRYMAHEDSALPSTIKLVPGGKLNFFEACKHSFITYLIDVGDNGLPQWPWPLIALFYGVLALGLAIAFPFVLGKVAAEWSSEEMRIYPALIPPPGPPIPGVNLVPARQTVFAPWEKIYYLACMAAGLTLWIWGIWNFFVR